MTTENQDKDPGLNPEDLDLIDNSLEDEGKDDNELWSEFDQAEASAAGDAADTSTHGDDAGGAGSGDDDAAGAAAGDDDQSKADGDAPPATKSGDGESPDKQQQQAPDIWANAAPEQRAAYEAAQEQIKKLEQAERSNRGRISAMQRQMNELTRKPAADKAADGKQGQDTDSLETELKSVAEEYPEVAGPFVKVIKTLQERLDRQEKVLSAVGNDRQQQALDEQATLLTEKVPDWQELTERPELTEWLDSQPRHIREAAIRNADAIVDAEEAADVISRFKSFIAEQQGGNAQQQQNNAQGGNGAGQGKPNQQAMSGKRQRQLESAASAKSRGPGVASGISEDGDEETIWKQFDEQERRAARA